MIAEIIMYTGAAMVGLGILLVFTHTLWKVWGEYDPPEILAKVAITLALVGAVLFFIGILTGGCPDCGKYGRYPSGGK